MKDSSVRFVCKYCAHACGQYSMLVLHKLELHPLEYAEEKRARNLQKTQQNSVTEIMALGKQLDIVFSRNEKTTRDPLNATDAQPCSNRMTSVNAFGRAECPPARVEAVVKEIVAAARAQACPHSTQVRIEKRLNSSIYEPLMRRRRAAVPHLMIQNENPSDRRVNPSLKEEPKTPMSASLPYDEVTDTWLCPFCSSKHHAKLSAHVHIKLVHKNEDMGDFDLSAELHSPTVVKSSQVHFKWDELSKNLVPDHTENTQEKSCTTREAISSSRNLIHGTGKIEGVGPPYTCVYCGCSFKTKLNHLKHYYHQQCQVNSQQCYSKFGKCSAESTSGAHWRENETQDVDDSTLSRNAKQRRPGDELIRAALSTSRRLEVITKGQTKCPYCSQVLSSDHSFQIHLRLHNACRPSQYTEGSARFVNTQRLPQHSGVQGCDVPADVMSLLPIPSTHLPEISVRSEQILTSTFESCGNLHKTSRQENKKVSCVDQESSETSMEDVSSHVSCPQCRKDFRNVYYLAIHMTTHQGAKPFRCSECGAQFASSPSLSRHRRTHERRQLWERRSEEHQPLVDGYSGINQHGHSAVHAASGTDASTEASDDFSKGALKISMNDELTVFVNELIGDLDNSRHNDFNTVPSENSCPANCPIDMTMDSIHQRHGDCTNDTTGPPKSSQSNDPPMDNVQEFGHRQVSTLPLHERRSINTNANTDESTFEQEPGGVSTDILDIALLFSNFEFIEEAGSESSQTNPAEAWEVTVTLEQLDTPQISATQAEYMASAVDTHFISALHNKLCAFGVETTENMEEGNSGGFDIRSDHCYSREHEENHENQEDVSTQT